MRPLVGRVCVSASWLRACGCSPVCARTFFCIPGGCVRAAPPGPARRSPSCTPRLAAPRNHGLYRSQAADSEPSVPGDRPAARAGGAEGTRPCSWSTGPAARRAGTARGGRSRGAAVQENRAALPRAAATPQKGSAARGSARRSARGATPPFGAPTPTALAPGPAPQAADGSGSSRGDTCSVQRRRNGSRSGAAPQPGKSACRVRSAMSDAAPSPSLERINVSELQSVVTNNNNNKLPCCCSIAQTNDRREPRGAFPRLAAAPPRGPARPQRAAGGDGPPRPMGLGPQRVGASLWPRGGTLLSRQPRGTGDRSATRPEQC
nr:translation initiation factor IF-2-like [Anas platyrhynchos]|eukprot:XP_027326929.1 uncharacterized protein LOC113845485 [Anas platyrhynchos]